MFVHTVYHPGTLVLVYDDLLCIRVDYDVPLKVSSTDNTESLVLAFLATIIVEPLFLYWES